MTVMFQFNLICGCAYTGCMITCRCSRTPLQGLSFSGPVTWALPCALRGQEVHSILHCSTRRFTSHALADFDGEKRCGSPGAPGTTSPAERIENGITRQMLGCETTSITSKQREECAISARALFEKKKKIHR